MKGPADRLMGPLGIDVSCVGVAREYREFCSTLVIDTGDAAARRRDRGARRARGRRRHADDRRARRRRARTRHARRRRLTVHARAAAHPHPGPRHPRGPSRRRARAADRRRRRRAGHAPPRRRLPRGHPEDRLEGRGPAGAASTPTTATRAARSSSRSRCASCAAAATSIISETAHGFVCANAGVDLSNVDDGWAALLPVDSDRSARRIRDALRATRGVEVAVVVSDTFGRPWRHGLTDVAIGVAGLAAVVDLRGTEDAPRPRAPGHRGRGRRRDRGRRRAGDGQVGRRCRSRSCAASTPRGSARAAPASWCAPRPTTSSDEVRDDRRRTMTAGR